jgi:hypothetical protein
MPMCDFPGCQQYAQTKHTRCSAHAKANAKELRAAQLVIDAEARKQQEAVELAARSQLAQKKADAEVDRREFQAEVIRRHRQTWNAQVDAVVSQVLALRVTHPNANAGNNPGGNTLGGTGNPVTLTMTGATHGVGKADVLSGMAGLDSSDSGYYKFRRKEVLVHCQ